MWTMRLRPPLTVLAAFTVALFWACDVPVTQPGPVAADLEPAPGMSLTSTDRWVTTAYYWDDGWVKVAECQNAYEKRDLNLELWAWNHSADHAPVQATWDNVYVYGETSPYGDNPPPQGLLDDFDDGVLHNRWYFEDWGAGQAYESDGVMHFVMAGGPMPDGQHRSVQVRTKRHFVIGDDFDVSVDFSVSPDWGMGYKTLRLSLTPDDPSVPGIGLKLTNAHTPGLGDVEYQLGAGPDECGSMATSQRAGRMRITRTRATASGYDCSIQTEIPKGECEALVAFYQATNGPSWTNNWGWLVSPPCEWAGVWCHSGHVRSFHAGGNNNVSGQIPAAIGNLTGLWWLHLSRDDLNGPIPPELGNLSELVDLTIHDTNLSGALPAELGNLTRLTGLNIWNNNLSGPIPPELGNLTSLVGLNLWNNNLTGPIPPELGNLTGLDLFLLAYNDLSGLVPIEVARVGAAAQVSGGCSFQGNALYMLDAPEYRELALGSTICRLPLVPLQVAIDIKPGSDPNSINCDAEGETITVAILTNGDFDATAVDHTTVSFEGAGELHVNTKTGELRRHEEDVDEDGDMDLVLHFRSSDTDLTCDAADATLKGETFGGTRTEGTDAVRMIG